MEKQISFCTDSPQCIMFCRQGGLGPDQVELDVCTDKLGVFAKYIDMMLKSQVFTESFSFCFFQLIVPGVFTFFPDSELAKNDNLDTYTMC